MSIYVNDYDIGRLVYSLSQIDGHLAPSVPAREVTTLGNAPGLWSTRVSVNPRDIVVGCDVRPTTLADRQTIMDRLSRRLSGQLELRTADLPTRFVRGRLSGVTVELYGGSFAQTACWVTLTFSCPDPAREDQEPLVYGLSTSRTACPVGTQTSAPQCWIYGPCTNPELTVRSAAGTEVSRINFTATLGANDALYFDAGTQQLVRYAAGVMQTGAASGLAAYTGGSFPLLSPEDATPSETAWPTVQLLASTGTPTGLILYARRW